MLNIGERSFLSEHVVDRIADEPEHGERDKSDHQEYHDGLNKPAYDESEHCVSSR